MHNAARRFALTITDGHMRRAVFVIISWMVLWSPGAAWADCVVTGPRPQFDVETIQWTLVIASGQSCVRGLRSGAMVVRDLRISAPAQVGEVTAAGYGFVYKAPRDFRGDDSFSVSMSGVYNGIPGSTTVQVHVSVR